MKKLLALLLAMLLLVSVLAGCEAADQKDDGQKESGPDQKETTGDEKDDNGAALTPDDEEAGGQDVSDELPSLENMTQEDWNKLAEEAVYDNVTMAIWAAYISGSENVVGLGDGVEIMEVRINGDQGFAHMGNLVDDGVEYSEYMLAADELETIKNVYVGSALSILENFDAFTYNPSLNVFESAGPISYNIEIATLSMTATLTVTDVVVEVDRDGNLATVSCTMKQEQPDSGFECVLAVMFAFWDYGTTNIPVG